MAYQFILALLLINGLCFGQDKVGQFELLFSTSPKNTILKSPDIHYCSYDGVTERSPGFDFSLAQRFYLFDNLAIGVSQNLHSSNINSFTHTFGCGPGQICAWDTYVKQRLISFGMNTGYKFTFGSKHSIMPWIEALLVSDFNDKINTEYTYMDDQGDTHTFNRLSRSDIKLSKPILWYRMGLEYRFQINPHLGILFRPSIEMGELRLNCTFPPAEGLKKIELRLPLGISYRF